MRKIKSPISVVMQTVCYEHVNEELQSSKDRRNEVDLILRITRDWEECWWCKFEMEHDYKEKHRQKVKL